MALFLAAGYTPRGCNGMTVTTGSCGIRRFWTVPRSLPSYNASAIGQLEEGSKVIIVGHVIVHFFLCWKMFTRTDFDESSENLIGSCVCKTLALYKEVDSH